MSLLYLGALGSKKINNFPSKGGGVSELGTVPKLYLVINYDGFPHNPTF